MAFSIEASRVGVERPEEGKGITIEESQKMAMANEKRDFSLLQEALATLSFQDFCALKNRYDWHPKALEAVTRIFLERVFPRRDCVRNQNPGPEKRLAPAYPNTFEVYQKKGALLLADPKAYLEGLDEEGKARGA